MTVGYEEVGFDAAADVARDAAAAFEAEGFAPETAREVLWETCLALIDARPFDRFFSVSTVVVDGAPDLERHTFLADDFREALTEAAHKRFVELGHEPQQ